MKKILTLITAVILSVIFGLALGGCTVKASSGQNPTTPAVTSAASSSASSTASSGNAGQSSSSSLSVTKDGTYTDKEHVALYIHLYGHVPSNYVTKTKARKAGWVNTDGNLWDVLPGKSIGGGGFNNDDGTLPDAPGREWYECDIDYDGGFRNSKRIVYSDDGLVFYTGDHYKTFEQLY